MPRLFSTNDPGTFTMSDPLQPLLERIQAEGIAKAQQQADALLQKARMEADQIRENARREAEALRQQASRDAAASVERGRKTLELSARDLLLTIQAATLRYFEILLRQNVEKALAPEAVHELIRTTIKEWLSAETTGRHGEIHLSPETLQTLRNTLLQEMQSAAEKGLLIHADPALSRGFKVVRREEHVELDFTPPAIAEALGRLLRPHLAEIVQAAAQAVRQETKRPSP